MTMVSTLVEDLLLHEEEQVEHNGFQRDCREREWSSEIPYMTLHRMESYAQVHAEIHHSLLTGYPISHNTGRTCGDYKAYRTIGRCLEAMYLVFDRSNNDVPKLVVQQ